jgi:hypothetical protein
MQLERLGRRWLDNIYAAVQRYDKVVRSGLILLEIRVSGGLF